MKLAVIIFDWNWKYIGQKVVEGDPSIFPIHDPVALDQWCYQVARQLANDIDDVHAVAAVINDASNEIAITPELVAEIQKGVKNKKISHCERWEAKIP